MLFYIMAMMVVDSKGEVRWHSQDLLVFEFVWLSGDEVMRLSGDEANRRWGDEVMSAMSSM